MEHFRHARRQIDRQAVYSKKAHILKHVEGGAFTRARKPGNYDDGEGFHAGPTMAKLKHFSFEMLGCREVETRRQAWIRILQTYVFSTISE